MKLNTINKMNRAYSLSMLIKPSHIDSNVWRIARVLLGWGYAYDYAILTAEDLKTKAMEIYNSLEEEEC